MKGYSPKLPLTLDPVDGLRLTKSLKEVAQQNLKMLVLTSPGERIWEPSFGVGLYNFLFELDTQLTKDEIVARVHSQVNRYLPFIEIIDIRFGEDRFESTNQNTLAVAIEYAIPSLSTVDVLRISTNR